jgi:integrase
MACVRRIPGDRANWYLDYRVGKKRFIRKHGPSKEAAAHTLRKILTQVNEDTYTDPRKFQSVTLLDVITKHRAWAETNRRSYKSSVEPALGNLRRFFGDQFPAARIDTDIADDYKSHRLKQGAARATVNRELAEWKRMWRLAFQRGQLPDNKIAVVQKLRCDNRRLRWLSVEEAERLLDASQGYLKWIVLCALMTGMRRSEITGLTWSQVNFETRTIQLTRTKSGKMRFVPINDTLFKVLIRLWRRRKSDYVFTTRSGNSVNDVKRSFHTALRRAGIAGFRFHDLRHTAASHMVQAGVGIATVAEILGITLQMAMRYSHLAPDHKLAAVRRLDSIFPNSFQKERKTTDEDEKELAVVGVEAEEN